MEHWRVELGTWFLVRRERDKRWPRAEAARKAKMHAETIQNIELAGNFEIDSAEKYARAFGTTLEAVLREVLQMPVRWADPRLQQVVAHWPAADDTTRAGVLKDLLAAAAVQPTSGDASDVQSQPEIQETAHGKRGPRRKD